METMKRKFALPAKFKDSTYSVWADFTEIVDTYRPLNLGQGFPDYSATNYVSSVLADVATSNDNSFQQYSRGFGHTKLVNILSKFYSKLLNRQINPMTEILITCGADGAINSAIAGLVEEGDEVIIIEPYYDTYGSIVRIFGGVPKFIPLKYDTFDNSNTIVTSAAWKLDQKELENAFNNKTKMFILNTPHNPTGKVFNYDELESIANLCKKYNVVCLSDEVYEWLVYKPSIHIRMASLPGMWERTLTIGSAGKTFSVTGWKCGWMYGPDYLIRNSMIDHQNKASSLCTPIQEALSRCFEKELNYLETSDSCFQNLTSELLLKRNSFIQTLIKAGFKPTIPEAGYFIVADWSNFENKIDLSSEEDEQVDFKFVKWLTKNVKLLGIPPSAFYSKDHKLQAGKHIRFCFFKKEDTLSKAHNILMSWKKSLDDSQL